MFQKREWPRWTGSEADPAGELQYAESGRSGAAVRGNGAPQLGYAGKQTSQEAAGTAIKPRSNRDYFPPAAGSEDPSYALTFTSSSTS